MTKELILQRLLATINMLKELPERSFDYSNYVKEFDIENKCGTVCCVAGWYPKYFPEAGLVWQITTNNHELKIELESDILGYGTFNDLVKYHGLSKNIIYALFYGSEFIPCNIQMLRVQDAMYLFSLKGVIERFESVYNYIIKSKNSKLYKN